MSPRLLCCLSMALCSAVSHVSSCSGQTSEIASAAAEPEVQSAQGARDDAEAQRLRLRMLELGRQLIAEFPGSEEPMTFMGLVLHGQGKNRQAMSFWRQCLAINPNRPDVLVNMGSVAMKDEDYAGAIDYWSRALTLNPTLSGVHLSIGQAYLAQGELVAAIAALEQGLAGGERVSDYQYYLAKAFALQGDYAQAKQRYVRVIQADPMHVNAYYGLFTACSRLGEREEAQKYLDFYQRHRAKDQQQTRDQDSAARLAGVKDSAAQLFAGVSQIYLKHGQVDKAIGILQETVRLRPDHLPALRQLTQLLQQRGAFDQALAVGLRVTQAAPTDPQGHFVVGNLALRLKQYDRAETSFRRVVDLAPQSPHGYRELARTLYIVGRDLREARRYAEQTVALQPAAENLFVLGLICIKQGDRASATVALQRAAQMEPGNAQYQKAYAYAQQSP